MGETDSTELRAAAERLPPHGWAAQMIRPLADQGVGTPASFLERRFTVSAVGGAETLRISALGLYRCFINGKRVGNDLLTPGWTCYDKRLSYQTYQVGELLKPGENVIDIWLGDGWLRSQLMWKREAIFNTWGNHIAAIAELRASGAPDAPILVMTDTGWQSGELPIRKSGIYFGEIYDAGLEDRPAGAGSAAMDFDVSVLIPHETTPVRELAPIAVKESWTDGAGRTLYDFGQNSAGYVRFAVRGKAGTRVIVEHSEILDETRNLDNANYRSAQARLEYVLAGRGDETYAPTFTFEGFRYARLTIEGEADILSIVSVPITSALSPAGTFTSGHALVNRLVENTIWSQRGNFIEVPTDCPQRDERLGWTGDAQVFAPAACYLNDSHDFLVKYLRDVMVDQRPDGAISHISPDPSRMQPHPESRRAGSTGWGDAICVIPMVLHAHYGDTEILRETLPAMVRWVDFVWSISDGPIVRPPRGRDGRGFTFGDWLQPKGPSEKPLPTIGDDAAATIYLYIASMLTAEAARIVGEDAIAARHEARAADVKTAFQHEFIAPSGRLVYDDQTSYALAILYDLIPEALLPATADYFKATIARAEGRIQTGFIGTPALLPALVKIGEVDLAGKVFLQEDVPGWLYQVRNGATTIWERWDAILPDGRPFDPAMNSYNHYAYGAVCQWLFEAAAGFRPDPARPGFAHIIFEPVIIPALSPVAAQHDSRAGRIAAGWSIEGDRVTYDLAVPEGAAATLRLRPDYADVEIDGVGQAGRGGEHALASGPHRVRFSLAR
jgi:alpha-L-rhamnosidase